VRIAFVLGPYRPNSCGVSDYVKLLGEALEKRGHYCVRISISGDKGSTFDDLSKNLPEADIISLQFSPYAFSPKGLSGSSFLRFATSICERELHVMFHEIWIGAYPNAPWKERFGGWRQKREISRFLKLANPNWVHTTNSAALYRLQAEGTNATYLQLFGGIPIFETKHPPKDKSSIYAIMFGTLYEKFPYEDLIGKICQLEKESSRKVQLTLVGIQREKTGVNILRKLAEKAGILIQEKGQLSPDKISLNIQRSDMAISTTPLDALGKSMSTAAFLEHGLPVIAFDDGDTPMEELLLGKRFDKQILLLNETDCVEKLLEILDAPNRSVFDGISHTAEKMLAMFS
jgi:glycosyltransferase involved in cell wall biosynthesis